MAEPFLSEIRLFSFNFPPKGWALCNGQLLPINQNQGLFSLLGTRYGGNGQTNFALPNLRGRVPIHFGNNHTLGEAAGQSANTLTVGQMPTHNHNPFAGSADGALASPVGNYWGSNSERPYSGNLSNLVAMSASDVSNTGGSQPHNNMMPYLVLNFCIALQGIFPSPN